jgi:kynureninase
MDPGSLYRSPNALAPHYSRFRVSDRLLLTGHSHQAWPDRGFEAQSQAWLDAARYVDDKWDHAFERAQKVREGFTPRLVTTDGEFHTIRRQLDRLAEEGLEVVRVAEQPVETVSERLAAAVDGRTALVLVSAVFFDTGRIVRGLGEVAASCRRHGAALLVDVYHALNVVPFSLTDEGLGEAWVVGGGYKYCQLGEGNCFLRLPPGTTLRPAVTGWYSEFTALTERGETGRVVYGQGGDRFAGATYDPTSHYRAAAVFEVFREQGLTPALLREVSQHQIGELASAFDSLDLDPAAVTRDRTIPLGEIGGFLALRSPLAASLARELHAREVMIDTRADVLRFGPAPYLSDAQLRDAMGALGEVVRGGAR